MAQVIQQLLVVQYSCQSIRPAVVDGHTKHEEGGHETCTHSKGAIEGINSVPNPEQYPADCEHKGVDW